MISIMIKSAIVLAVAACIASVLRRQSAALRHAIWTAGLIGALVVPGCSITLPAWQNGFVGWAESIFQTGIVETSSPAPSAVFPTEPQRSRHQNQPLPHLLALAPIPHTPGPWRRLQLRYGLVAPQSDSCSCCLVHCAWRGWPSAPNL
jgi:hypothetical protein